MAQGNGVGVKSCSLAADEFHAFINLSFGDFDQAMTGGWRAVAHRGCELTAAMLIDTYIADEPSRMSVVDRENLAFHAGQMYAYAGLPDVAAHRLLRSLSTHTVLGSQVAWNPYVLATVAFLQRDGAALLSQREALAASTPTPANKINLLRSSTG